MHTCAHRQPGQPGNGWHTVCLDRVGAQRRLLGTAAKIVEVGRGREAAPTWAVAILLPGVDGVQNSGFERECPQEVTRQGDHGIRVPTQTVYALLYITVLSKGQEALSRASRVKARQHD